MMIGFLIKLSEQVGAGLITQSMLKCLIDMNN